MPLAKAEERSPRTRSAAWSRSLRRGRWRGGDEALNAMNPGASERRTSVEFFEVTVSDDQLGPTERSSEARVARAVRALVRRRLTLLYLSVLR